MSARGSRTTLALTAVLLLAAGCASTSQTPDAATSPTGTSASPVPTISPTPSPSASPTPTTPPSPSPTTTGPAAEADGCPPAIEDRATLPPAVDELPATSNDLVTESPRGRPIEVTLSVLNGTPAAEKITATVRAAVQDVVAAWDEAVGPPAQDEADRPAPELQLDVTVARLGTRLVSFELDGFRYLGGASGDAVTDAWTFSTATGQQLTLADVGLDGPCLDELGELAADALTEQGVGMFEEAAAALRAGEVSMQRWAVTGESLRIHFPEYEVAPGAAGAPVAELPLADVRAATGTSLGG